MLLMIYLIIYSLLSLTRISTIRCITIGIILLNSPISKLEDGTLESLVDRSRKHQKQILLTYSNL